MTYIRLEPADRYHSSDPPLFLAGTDKVALELTIAAWYITV
ncbi:hypothetical protein V6C45_21120 [Paenibacillus barengoltzii]